MSSSLPVAPLDPAVLVATFTDSGDVVHRNPAWIGAFGDDENPWRRVAQPDQQLVLHALGAARAGRLVTNQIATVTPTDRPEPVPILLNFLPVHLPGPDGALRVQAVTITGEVLAEPTSWTTSQTQRHRMETLGRMTMGIVHDFNNLLSGILGYTELMRTLIGAGKSLESFGEHLRTVEQAALDGAALVRKIQRYIRQEKEERFEPIDLRDLLQDCVSLTRPYWYNEPRRQGIAIDVETDFEDIPAVNGSGPELREVFINLILNAVQAMPQGGHLRFALSLQQGRGVCVEVSDTGIGMADEVRERIFEPLFTTKGANGTGMGLAVSYGIIQAHDGAIRVHSTLGRGSRFEIVLPPARNRPTPDAPPRPVEPDVSARILIVDDERMVRSVLSKLLSLKGHETAQAASGEEALELVAAQPFDLVITDHGMPQMSGLQLARHLRDRNPDLPVVLLTGDSEVEHDQSLVSALLPKPFQLDEVQAVIHRLLQHAPVERVS